MILDYIVFFTMLPSIRVFPKQPTLWETISLTLPGV